MKIEHLKPKLQFGNTDLCNTADLAWYILLIAVHTSSACLRFCRTFRGFGHFTTRQNQQTSIKQNFATSWANILINSAYQNASSKKVELVKQKKLTSNIMVRKLN